MNDECPQCGCEIDCHQAIRPGHCGKPACVTKHIVQTTRAAEVEKGEDYAAACVSAKRDKAHDIVELGRQHSVELEDLTVGIVPFQDGRLSKLPEDRRLQFVAHLDTVLESAFDPELVSPSFIMFEREARETLPVVSAACGTCQGACCERGADGNAFISSDLIRYFHQKTPELTAEIVRAAYLDALPEMSVTASCVFHTEIGCALDRNLRANICNTFYCNNLTSLMDLIEYEDKPLVAIIGIDEDTGESRSLTGFNRSFPITDGPEL